VDNGSGIAEYDYATTTSLLLSGVASSAVVAPTITMPLTWASAGGRTDMPVTGLHLTAATPVYVVARAKNGQGLLSAIGTSVGVYFDSTPPAWPANAALTRYGSGNSQAANPPRLAATVASCAVTPPSFPAAPTSGSASGIAVGAAMSSAAAWTGVLPGASSGSSSGAAVPSASFNMPAAHDYESGLRDYFVRLDRAPGSTPDSLHWEEFAANHTAFTVSFPSADYQNPYYVSLVARNMSNQYSAALVYGPFVASDQTPPSYPTFCAGMGTGAGQLAVQLTAPSADPETGVRGYQYRVRDAASNAVVRNFPATTDTVDWSQAAAGAVLRTRALPMTDGHQYYLDLRAVNGQGYATDVLASGPFLYDASSPPTPVATATYGSGAIAVTVNAGSDPQSGLMGLQVAVGKSATGADILPWQEIGNVPSGQSTISLPVGTLLIGAYYVQVREVNGVGWAGATTTTSFTVTPVIPSLPGGGVRR
jgi:hypothetical protein